LALHAKVDVIVYKKGKCKT